MPQALITIIAPLPLSRLDEAQAKIDKMGNPAIGAIRDALDKSQTPAIHFASFHAVASSSGRGAYLILELSADGSETAVVEYVAQKLEPWLLPTFMMAQDWKDPSKLAPYLNAHRVAIGVGLLDNAGLAFSGTPDRTVSQIQFEDRLAQAVAAEVGRHDAGAELEMGGALARLESIRRFVAADTGLAEGLKTAQGVTAFKPASVLAVVPPLLLSFFATYLWPVLLIVAAIGPYVFVKQDEDVYTLADAGRVLLYQTVPAWIYSGLAALLLVAVAFAFIYFQLRDQEARDAIDDRIVPVGVNAAMFARENQAAQNHMISITERKPGFVRWFTLRLTFWVIAGLSGRIYAPGFLGEIGSIHFARWVTPPGSRDLIFFSNYGGSWESYLEDFITLAHNGLTGVWSNAVGFPRANNLFQDGATDGDRFKRYARRSMIPTRFWYSAYPGLTTPQIRNNAEIRRGLSSAMTEDDARLWLTHFGSAARPAPKIISNEIQSLVFGGLGFMPFGACLIVTLPQSVEAARAWLRSVSPHVAFGDGRRLGADAVISLALGANGLRALGLPEEGVTSFSFAFVEGMTSPSRARILGDLGKDAQTNWNWGKTQPDVALLVYGYLAEHVDALVGEIRQICGANMAAVNSEISLNPVTKSKREPFGFVDGISQPVIRGTYKGRSNADPIHLVQPGEFILGYADNRGNFPPGPTMPSATDPWNRLPVRERELAFSRTEVDKPREIGLNGTYLVIRQLEQHVEQFESYCREEALRLRDSLEPPYEINEDYVAAKLMGRWRDGSSLVRHPYESHSRYSRRVKRRNAAMRDAYSGAHGDLMHASEAEDVSTRPKAAPSAGVATDPPAPKEATATSVTKSERTYSDNSFLFGVEDPQGLSCPFGAHIRRANPRDSLEPGSQDQIDITNRHRIIRVGRSYKPDAGKDPGLLFMCLNADIERQFEFLQQTWMRSASFQGLSSEMDPLMGDEGSNCGFTVPTPNGPLRLKALPKFVTMKGGGYFFLPGKRLLEFLAAGESAP